MGIMTTADTLAEIWLGVRNGGTPTTKTPKNLISLKVF